MTLSPLDLDSLSYAQYENMTADLESLLCSGITQHDLMGLQFIYPDDPHGTFVAVHTLDQLIDLSLFLGSHNMLFDGVKGHWYFYPAGTMDDEDRLELYVLNYAPIPDPIKEYRLVVGAYHGPNSNDDLHQIESARQLVRAFADRWEVKNSDTDEIVGYFSDHHELCLACMTIVQLVNDVSLSSLRVFPPQV